ncbi:MAG TPA: SDR family oxidoreductase [Myxococcota bacterium]|nr:SDR family oxidoreductase [Myxococcota bacterium]
MSPRHALVIGANRGIGLELARQLLARGARVTATYRDNPGGLGDLDLIAVGGVDLERPETLAALGADTATPLDAIDDLIVNAGIYPKDRTHGHLDPASILRGFAVNAMGPLLAVDALKTRLSRGARVLLITSRMGSIADNDSGGSYAYRMSKAALNMAGKTLSLDLKSQGVSVALIHPGWVKTDMTSNQGLIDVHESAAGILARLDQLDLSTSGTFWHQNGQVLPW